MISNPSVEHDIRLRAAGLADAILATNPQSDTFKDVRNAFRDELENVALPTDNMTWFALGRVAARLHMPASWVKDENSFIPEGGLVMIDQDMEVPRDPGALLARLEKAGFILAPPSWKATLNGPQWNTLNISGEIEAIAIAVGPTPNPARTRKP